MFTLYRIGFCSVSEVAPVQCEQKLMCRNCFVAFPVWTEVLSVIQFATLLNFLFENIINQYEVPLYVLLRWKCSDLTRTVSKTCPIRNVPLSTAEQNSPFLEQELLRKQRSWCEQKPFPVDRYIYWRHIKTLQSQWKIKNNFTFVGTRRH